PTKRPAPDAAFSDPFRSPSSPAAGGARDAAPDRRDAVRHYELQRGGSDASSSYRRDRAGAHRELERAPTKTFDAGESKRSASKASSDDDDDDKKKSSPDLGSNRRRR